MTPDRLFLETLRDLRARVATTDEYQILRASLLLRQLLLDGTPLMDRVNRHRRLRIQFEVVPPDQTSDAMFDYQNLCPVKHVDLELASLMKVPEQTVELKRDDFLALTVFWVDDDASPTVRIVDAGAPLTGAPRGFTVAEVVNYLAHVEGGVHAGDERTQVEKALGVWNRGLRFEGLPFVLGRLREVAFITLAALEPLRRAVESGVQSEAP